MEFKFNLDEEVLLPELVHNNLTGRIKSIWITTQGIKYEVRYFWESIAKEVYFYESELKKKEN